jgi:hypothetical protein
MDRCLGVQVFDDDDDLGGMEEETEWWTKAMRSVRK